jgi:pimeloyl-ACP methyl ester carboxylesterase
MKVGAWMAACVVVAATTACAQPLAPGESNVTAQNQTGKLAGVMQAATSGVRGAPAAIIIPGSGPTDHNGDSPLGISAAPYQYLAHALAPLGITTVRIDKRGMFGSAGAGDPNHVTLEGYADDVRAWIAAVRQATGAPCAWIIGHSEGGLVALVAAQKPEGICGLVLISTPGLPIADVLRAQLKANPANAPILAEALADVDKLAAGQHIDQSTMNPALLPLFRADVQDFEIEEFKLDQAALAAAYKGPILVVQGENDLQVSVADAQRIAAARPGIRLTLVPGMNHVLKQAPADRAGNAATYADPNLPLAPGVADGIAAFIKSPPTE